MTSVGAAVLRLMTVLAVALAVGAAPSSGQVQDSVALEALTREVAAQLRCVVCQGLSIQDSPSELAQDMRGVVKEQLAAGKTPDEVKAYFVARYGEWVLLQPRATGFNLVVYVLPMVALLAGALAVVVLARRWSAKPEGGANAVESALADDPDLADWDELVPRG